LALLLSIKKQRRVFLRLSIIIALAVANRVRFCETENTSFPAGE
jgi:hypothetical protein